MGDAGVLIKTPGAILDNQLFKYQGEEAAHYFFGEANIEGIYKRLKEEDFGVLNISRNGLNWKDEYCQMIRKVIEEKLEKYVKEKKNEIERNVQSDIPASKRKLIIDIQKLLNRIAKSELQDEDLKVPVSVSEVDDLIVKPEIANLQLNEPRVFTLYLPERISNEVNRDVVTISPESPHVRIINKRVTLVPHPSYKEIYFGRFKAVGLKEGVKTYINCKLSEEYFALVEVSVGPYRKGQRRKQLLARKGGFVRDIQTDGRENPTRRVSFDRDFGIIKVFVNFPPISNYLGIGLKGIEEPKGRLMLAELVTEAFCRELAKRAIETGRYPIMSNDPLAIVALYERAYDDMLAKYAYRIHKIINNWHSKE